MSVAELLHYARVASQAGALDDAVALLAAVGDLPSPRLWLQRANLHRELCEPEAARAALDRAVDLGDPSARLRRALLLPPIMGDEEAIAADRARMAAELAALEADPPHLDDPVAQLPWLDFYLAYHGGEDRTLREALARVLRRAAPSLTWTSPHLDAPAQGPVRLGLCSSHLRDHTIGRLNEALVEGLGGYGIDVVLLLPDPPADAFAERLVDAAAEAVVIGRDLPEAQRAVAEARLDVLHYPDLGMDPFTWLLAFARLAPVQTVGWGHPITSGLDTVDAFLASAGLVPPGTERRFTEAVLRLPDPMTCWRPPGPIAPVPRAALGLPEAGAVYLCPQNAFKLHPAFDRVLDAVAHADPDGCIALLDPPKAPWRRAVEARMGPELASRILWVPRQPRERYLALLAAADVLLDPRPFGGGHTSLEALAVGTPIVTWPTTRLRGRITACWYGVMGCSDLVATDAEDYVAKAVAWAGDAGARAEVRRRLRVGTERLFDRDDAVAAHAALVHELARRGRRRCA